MTSGAASSTGDRSTPLLDAERRLKSALTYVSALRKELGMQTSGSARQLTVEAKLQKAMTSVEKARTAYAELRQQINLEAAKSLKLDQKAWEFAQQQVKEAKEASVSAEQLEQLVAEEKRMKAVLDRASLAHPLEADVLAIRHKKRKYNGATRDNDPQRYIALERERQQRFKMRRNMELSNTDSSLPEASTMQAFFDDMNAAGLWR